VYEPCERQFVFEGTDTAAEIMASSFFSYIYRMEMVLAPCRYRF